MNGMETSPQPVVAQPAAKTNFVGLFSLVLLLGLLIGFGFRSWLAGGAFEPAATITAPEDQPQPVAGVSQPTEPTAQIQFLTPETTKRLAFPVTKDGMVSFVSTEPGDLVIPYPDPVSWGGGWLGHGTTDPTVSPDMTKTALITKTGEFRVVNSEGKLIMSAGSAFKAGYITLWSPDSSAVIFSTSAPTLMTELFPQGPGSTAPTSVHFEPGLAGEGFYLVDLNAQKVLPLTPLAGADVLEWIDESRLLVAVRPQGSNTETFADFDLKTYQANSAPYKAVFENWFGPQMSFGRKGQKWAISLHQSAAGTAGTETAKIILADFPSITGTLIAEDQFAYIQQPLLSPNEDRVVYQGKDEVDGANFVYYFDGQKAEKLFEGLPLWWITNDSFVFAVFNPSHANNPEMADTFYRYDIGAKKTTELFKRSVAQ
jgi:hypothetical protein